MSTEHHVASTILLTDTVLWCFFQNVERILVLTLLSSWHTWLARCVPTRICVTAAHWQATLHTSHRNNSERWRRAYATHWAAAVRVNARCK